MQSSDMNFAEEVLKFNKGFQQLKSDIAITKNVNSQLHNHFFNMGRKCQANVQYSRRECVKIVGIPTSVPDNELEETLAAKAIRFVCLQVSRPFLPRVFSEFSLAQFYCLLDESVNHRQNKNSVISYLLNIPKVVVRNYPATNTSAQSRTVMQIEKALINNRLRISKVF